VYALRIACCADYPGIIDEVRSAIGAVKAGPTSRVAVRNTRCVHIVSYWKHWPCLIPQHGPGRKHERPIMLEHWQSDVVEAHAGQFLRGLFHSDGCRFTNWTTRVVAGRPKRYEYPRYMFTNKSADILALCGWALDLLQIESRMANHKNLLVARRDSVRKLDEHVGPKS
jgi:hypothetical protein